MNDADTNRINQNLCNKSVRRRQDGSVNTLILVVKTQGENRERGDDGKLHATQDAWLKPAVCVDGHVIWWGPRKKTIGLCQKAAEEVFGALEWKGFPAFLSLTASVKSSIEVKAAAEWRRPKEGARR